MTLIARTRPSTISRIMAEKAYPMALNCSHVPALYA